MADMARLRVAVEAPQHTGLAAPLDYRSEQMFSPGTMVRVPLGRREVPGVVWHGESAAPPPAELRDVSHALDVLPPLGAHWRELVDFAAAYYQRGIGEVALSVLPPELRKLDNTQLANRIAKLYKSLAKSDHDVSEPEPPVLTDAQTRALAQIAALTAGGQ